VDSLYYDGLGNLVSTRSPLGFRTYTLRDALGRDSISYSPIDSIHALHVDSVRAYGARSEVTYDVMGRPVYTLSHGPARTHTPGVEGWAPRPSAVEELGGDHHLRSDGARAGRAAGDERTLRGGVLSWCGWTSGAAPAA
jgi:YD repeat-containing protein